LIDQEVGRQAQMLAFNDLFWFLGWFAFAMLPLLFLMKRPEKPGLVAPLQAWSLSSQMKPR
jgi:MFS transporter, DHA2 family, multidrug resistance protein